MNVLMITGDKTFGAGNPRYELQHSVVDRLEVVYWGQGSLFPRIPKGPFDVITAQDPFWRGHFAWHLTWFIRARLNMQVHTDLSAYSGLKRWWAGYNLRKANSVRVVSEKIKQQVIGLGVTAPITVLPVFVDISRFKGLPDRRGHLVKIILWIGRFEHEKNPMEAIEVLKKVMHAVPNVRLVMVGAGQWREKALDRVQEVTNYQRDIFKNASNLPIEMPLEVAGWEPDITLQLDRANVVLCTSLHESWGSSIVEALAAGVPVVAPDVGIAKEAGAIVVAREKLAEAVVDVLRNPPVAELKLKLLDKDAWAKAWRDSLI